MSYFFQPSIHVVKSVPHLFFTDSLMSPASALFGC